MCKTRSGFTDGVEWLLRGEHVAAFARDGERLGAAEAVTLVRALRVVFFTTPEIARVADAIVKAACDRPVRVVHAPEWRPLKPVPAGTIDGVHLMSDAQLVAAVEAALKQESARLVFRGDAEWPAPAGSEHVMDALATWAQQNYELEVEDPEVAKGCFEESSEAKLWVCAQPEREDGPPPRVPIKWRNRVVVSDDMRLGMCIDIMDASGKRQALEVDSTCVAQVCWQLVPKAGALESHPRSQREDAAVASVHLADRIPLEACRTLPDGGLTEVGLWAPGGLKKSGWDGRAVRRLARLAARVKVCGASAKEAEDMARCTERRTFQTKHLSIIPKMLAKKVY